MQRIFILFIILQKLIMHVKVKIFELAFEPLFLETFPGIKQHALVESFFLQ